MSQFAWQSLLRWLEGKGMDISSKGLLVERRETEGAGFGLYASKACLPSSILFSVPAKALINVKTLSSLLPRGDLSAVQFISLYLAVNRPGLNATADPHFGPYIAVLPSEFGFHPLSWMIDSSFSEAKLLPALPPSVRRALDLLLKRFQDDFQAVISHSEATNNDPPSEENYLWGWLNGLYVQLKSRQSDPDNLTLCPIFDMANHSSHLPHMWPRSPTVPLRWMTFMTPKDAPLAADAEVYLKYGAHSNRVLFTEYGFSVPVSTETIVRGEVDAEVDVSDLIEGFFAETQTDSRLDTDAVG